MYTRCPHCATIFHITAEQLRLTHGDVPCVTCAQPFSALESLSDDITTLIAAPGVEENDDETAQDEILDEADTQADLQFTTDIYTDEQANDTDTAATDDEEDTERHATPDLANADPDHGADDDHPDDEIEPETPFYVDETEPADDEQPLETMEFDAPEQTWTKFFLATDAIATPEHTDQGPVLDADPDGGSGGQPWISSDDGGSFDLQTADQDEWQRILAELGDDKSTTTAVDENQIAANEPEPGDGDEPPIIPPWLSEETPAEALEQRQEFRPSRCALSICAALALLLAGQLIHYNRDTLAASTTYGALVRGVYGLSGAPLYPDWPLDAFGVTGTDAISGRSDQNALDILANVIVHGQQPVGLPLIRVVLRDRWANPVASRVFEPSEYLRTFDAANPLVNPGTALPVEISVADPGAEASGYVIDVCLPRRKTGLECQIAKDPFK